MTSLLNYFKLWTPMRFIRLGLAILLAMQAWDAQLWVLLIPAVYLLLQAVFNFGCKNNCKV